MQKLFKLKSLVAAGGVAVFALLAAPVMTAGHVSLISAAQAAESHTDSDHGSDHGSKGGKGAMKGGSHESGGHGGASKSAESVLTTETEDEGKKGPKAGTSSGKKGKPAWAGDIAVTGYDSTVEMGRLNVAKAPASVLLRGHDEEFKVLVDAASNLYDSADWAAVLLALKSSAVRVDSPVANLGFYKDVLDGDGKVTMVVDGVTQTYVTNLTPLQQAAIFLGSAVNKEATYGTGIVEGTVKNLNIILGIKDMSAADVTSLAKMAEDVREAIEDAHEGTDTP